jgi:hypothetical protein
LTGDIVQLLRAELAADTKIDIAAAFYGAPV